MKLLELAPSQKPEVRFQKFSDGLVATIEIEKTQITVSFDKKKAVDFKSAWWIAFKVPSRGNASSAKIFAAVLDTIQDWFRREKPDKITLAGADAKRARIYEFFIKKTINKNQWEIEKVKLGNTFGFILTKK